MKMLFCSTNFVYTLKNCEVVRLHKVTGKKGVISYVFILVYCTYYLAVYNEELCQFTTLISKIINDCGEWVQLTVEISKVNK